MIDYSDMVVVKRPGRRAKAIRKDTKYKRAFAHQLDSGIRYKEGLSTMELCHRWKISHQTFKDWIFSIQEFREAYERSKADYATYWHENFKGIANGEIKGNAGCAIFAMTNIEGINWATKVDMKTTTDEEVKKIVIELLPAKPLAIEHQVAGDIVDAEIVIDNVVPINAK